MRLFVPDESDQSAGLRSALASMPWWHVSVPVSPGNSSSLESIRSDICRLSITVLVSPAYRGRDLIATGDAERGWGWLPYGSPDEMERALFLGADDFLCLPFSATELEVRARRIERDASSAGSYGSVFVVGGETIVLTGVQREVWQLLNRHRGRVVDRGAIARVAGIGDAETGETDTGDAGVGERSNRRGGSRTNSRAVDMLVSRLRRRVAVAGETIVTVRGRGYLLED